MTIAKTHNYKTICRKESSKRQVEMYADSDDIIPTPQLPPRNYDEGEHVNVLVQDTSQVSSMSILASNAVYAMFEAIKHQIYYIHECPYNVYTLCVLPLAN